MTESEYISFWKSVRALVNLPEGSEISLDWLGEKRKFIRARDERGRFTGTQSDTLAGWVRRMEKDGRYKGYLKRVLKEIFILQLLSGRVGHRQPQYSQKYRKRKEKTGAFAEAVSFASSFKVLKESFDPTQQSVYNLYYSGESMEEFYKSGTSKITEDGKSDIRVEFSITPSFASAEADANEHGRTLSIAKEMWRLDDQSIVFFIANVLMPYVKQHQGIIADMRISGGRDEDMYNDGGGIEDLLSDVPF